MLKRRTKKKGIGLEISIFKNIVKDLNRLVFI